MYDLRKYCFTNRTVSCLYRIGIFLPAFDPVSLEPCIFPRIVTGLHRFCSFHPGAD